MPEPQPPSQQKPPAQPPPRATPITPRDELSAAVVLLTRASSFMEQSAGMLGRSAVLGERFSLDAHRARLRAMQEDLAKLVSELVTLLDSGFGLEGGLHIDLRAIELLRKQLASRDQEIAQLKGELFEARRREGPTKPDLTPARRRKTGPV